MAKINLLDKHVAELIAAGEVVERPASVVKELVENSIDAGSSFVTVEIKNGGVSYLRVTDDGCGIAREDVPTAFLRHATSKVLRPDDLESIATLGFRGEALASVAAVAHVELLTRTEEELAGTRYVIEGGEERACEDAGCARGTTIVVRDLFYNTPARMKFLKKDTVESNAIAAVLDKIALSHPEISLRFLRDGKETLHTPGDGKLKSAVFAVFGREFTSGLIPVDYSLNGLCVRGFVSRPANARPNRSMQQFFINGRYVKSRTAMVALEQAFKGSLMVGKFPACVLHLEIAYRAVDVNVHPAKLEVRFLNERPVFDVIYHGVKTALNRGDAPSHITLPAASAGKPAAFPGAKPPEAPAAAPAAPSIPRVFSAPASAPPVLHDSMGEEDGIEVSVPRSPAYHGGPEREQPDDLPFSPPPAGQGEEPASASSPAPEKEPGPESVPGPQEPKPLIEKDTLHTARYIGEAFGTYMILQRGEELVLIDKHAAHERLLYEQLKEKSGTAFSQLLLQPVPVTLEKNEYSAVLSSLELCASAGFEIEDFGAGTVLVRSAPLSLEGSDVADAVMEIAGYLASSRTDVTTEHLDWLYHNIACRAAIKARDESSPQELIALARRLEENPQIRYCPHGRPIFIVLTRHELEKQFGRA
ncbi:MAG TPA: DNA mismatch repair endonuclease MutL [Ruminococcaceae bacterium]|nr:DNA mismatch repair endonuclease MutL [Oscillospiraceae bacterium]